MRNVTSTPKVTKNPAPVEHPKTRPAEPVEAIALAHLLQGLPSVTDSIRNVRRALVVDLHEALTLLDHESGDGSPEHEKQVKVAREASGDALAELHHVESVILRIMAVSPSEATL